MAKTTKVTVERKASASYTLRATAQNVKKLKELDLITQEELTEMIKTVTKAMQRHIGMDMFEEKNETNEGSTL